MKSGLNVTINAFGSRMRSRRQKRSEDGGGEGENKGGAAYENGADLREVTQGIRILALGDVRQYIHLAKDHRE